MNGSDDFRIRRAFAKLLTQLADQHVDVAIIREPLAIADPVHQLIAIHDFAGLFHERQQQLIFARRQLDHFGFWRSQFAFVQIEFPAFEGADVIAFALALLDLYPTDKIACAAEQFPGVKRLCNVIVSAALQSEDAVNLFLLGSHQNDTDVGFGAYLSGQGQSVFTWQLDIEQQQYDIGLVDDLLYFIAGAS